MMEMLQTTDACFLRMATPNVHEITGWRNRSDYAGINYQRTTAELVKFSAQ